MGDPAATHGAGKPLAFGLAALLAMAAGPVAYWEGYVPRTYADPVGIPTVCYGHTGRAVHADRFWTEPECRALLDGDLIEHWRGVSRCIQRSIHLHEAAAILSWTYNVGVGNACRSTLVRMVNDGAPAAQWCAELSRWVFAKGKRLRGLERRRGHERAICEGRG
jgi:lysozyme